MPDCMRAGSTWNKFHAGSDFGGSQSSAGEPCQLGGMEPYVDAMMEGPERSPISAAIWASLAPWLRRTVT